MNGKSITFFIISTLFTGCSFSPSINVVGAYFPAWLFCIVGAIVMASLVYIFIHQRKKEKEHHFSLMTFSLLVVALALINWIIFFKN